MALQNMQEFIPVRTPTANDKLSEGMLRWSMTLPPVTNILQVAALSKRDIHPVRIARSITPFLSVGSGSLLPKDFQYSPVNATPTSGSTTTSGQTGNPSTTGGTAATAPTPVVTNDVPLSYAVYTFKPTVTQSVATVTQLRSIVLSLSYYLPDWTFAIWIPSIQRYIEYVPSAINNVPQSWVTINAATNIEASGSASIEFIFGLRSAQPTDLTAPYGSIAVNNYKVDEHLFISSLGGTGGTGALTTRVTTLENSLTTIDSTIATMQFNLGVIQNSFNIAENGNVTFPGAVLQGGAVDLADGYDLNTLKQTGVFRIVQGAVNAPPLADTRLLSIISYLTYPAGVNSDSNSLQFASSYFYDYLYYRLQSDGTWSAWKQIQGV